MPKYYPVLSTEDFNTVHSFILDFINLKEEKGEEEALEELTPEIVEWGITIDQVISYLMDRMTLERGGQPSDRGKLFEKFEKQFKRDVDANRALTVARLKEEEDFSDLDPVHLQLTVDSSLLLTTYFPLAVSAEEATPLEQV